MGDVVSSYQRRFPVVYLTLRAMRRPRLANSNTRSALFCVPMCIHEKKNNGGCRKSDIKSRSILKVVPDTK